MESPSDGIIYSSPVLGQLLFVRNNEGEMVDCGQVLGCEYKVVTRGSIGHRIEATMIFVRTSIFSKGFMTYPATADLLPESYQRTFFMAA